MKLEIEDLAQLSTRTELPVVTRSGSPTLAGTQSKVLLALALVCLTLIAYYPVKHNDFIAMDDPDYVSVNAQVQQGFNLTTVKWAFTTFHAANWHPVTWLSHMADCQLVGVDPAAHHLTNLLLHVIN